MKLAELVAASEAVRATRSRNAKRDTLADIVGRTEAGEIQLAVSYLSGRLPGGRIGLGYAMMRDAATPAAAEPSLALSDVDAAIAGIAAATGKGSVVRRREILQGLMQAATAAEQRFLKGLLLGELRQGASESSMVDALAVVADTAPERVRRALMLSGDLTEVALAVVERGTDSLDGFVPTLFRPIRPMLAQTAGDVAAAIERTGPASIEAKLDGARIQVHRQDDRVAVYTRNLNDITDRLPEVVAAARAWDVMDAIVDGEVIALDEQERPLPFQVTMGRFGSESLLVATGTDASDAAVPLTAFYFDCLRADGRDLLDRPLTERREVLERVVGPGAVTDRLVSDDGVAAGSFFQEVLATGHEGVMVKGLDSTYRAGRRGAAWLKVKPAHTLDLVVIAVEWGSGRRQGWLSNLHLAARDAGGEFVMLGKTFKGLTDETLQWQTERFLKLETRREGHVVFVRPEQVVEIAFDGIQSSSRYPGGMALRFARVRGYRQDKGPGEADTIGTVRAIFEGTG